MQQNSALIEEALAAESLTEQTGQLTGALWAFKLDNMPVPPANVEGKRLALSR